MFHYKWLLATLCIVLIAGSMLVAQQPSEMEDGFYSLIREIASLREDLAAMEARILADGSTDLVMDEWQNFEFEKQIHALAQALLEIEERFLTDEKPALLEDAMTAPPTIESLTAGLQLLRIEEMIALAKGEISAAWQESSMIQQKLTLELKQDLAEILNNESPVPCFTPSNESPQSGEPVTFLDCSEDPDGQIVERRWDFGDNTTSDEPNPEHQFSEPGTYRVQLEVTDDKGVTTDIVREIEVLPVPPVACFTVQEEVIAGAPVDLTDCSEDPDGEIVTWAWDLGDNQTSNDTDPQHVFDTPGVYTITLRVTDDQGLTDETQRVITVISSTGSLQVVLSDEALADRGRIPKDIHLVLDLSSSMEEEFENSTKFLVAKDVIHEVIGQLPISSMVGLRTFHRCGQSELEVPIGPLENGWLAAELDRLETYGTTPLAYTLRRIPEDLEGLEGPHLILFITDGIETCNDDPVAAAEELAAAGYDIMFRLLGYDISRGSGQRARDQLRAISEAAGGLYIDIDSREDLLSTIQSALPTAFSILDSSGTEVWNGFLGDDPVELKAGTYSVVVTTDPQLVIEDIVIESDVHTTITVSPE